MRSARSPGEVGFWLQWIIYLKHFKQFFVYNAGCFKWTALVMVSVKFSFMLAKGSTEIVDFPQEQSLKENFSQQVVFLFQKLLNYNKQQPSLIWTSWNF